MFEEEDKTFIKDAFSSHVNEIKEEVKIEISSIKKEMASFNNKCHETHKEVDDRINDNFTTIKVVQNKTKNISDDHKTLSNRFWGFIVLAVVTSVGLIIKIVIA